MKKRIVIYLDASEEKKAAFVAKHAGFKKISSWAGVVIRRAITPSRIS